jgi:tetratricopeptide (TPR) repeat protein/predicted Ser/Thr protein kinase
MGDAFSSEEPSISYPDPPLPADRLMRFEDLGLAELLRQAGNTTTNAATYVSPSGMPSPSVPSGYEVLEELGRGGMGVVYKARQTALKRFVALKMIRTGPAGDPELLGRLRVEAEAVAALQHPHVVQVFDVLEHQGQPVLVLEYLPGGNLGQRLAGNPLPAWVAAELVETLALAVQACHERGIVHRDLKPTNILLTENGTPKVSDFGLAKKLDTNMGQTRSGQILGTPSYMAPELTVDQAKEVGPAADVYALGAILYEMVTGGPPFRGAGLLATLEQVRSLDPVPPVRLQPGLPRDLQTICLKCLAKEPGKRYASAAALAEDLAHFRQGQPIRARPVGLFERVRKWARRKPAWAALILVSALGLTALGVGATVYQRRLQTALGDVRHQQVRADGNYRLARATFDRMLERLTDHSNADLAPIQQLRREQAEDALAFFDGIAQQDATDLEVRFDVARARLAAGRLQYLLGRKEPAGENVRCALRELADLAAAFPGEPRYRFEQAHCLRALGNWQGTAGLVEEAFRCGEQALGLAQALLDEDPESEEYQALAVDVFNELGTSAFAVKRLPDAEKYMRRAHELQHSLVRHQPGRRDYRKRLAEMQVNLSVICQGQARPAEAKEFHDQAEANLEKLNSDYPRDFTSILSLATLRVNWAYVLVDRDKKDEALADLAKSIPGLEKLRQQEPDLDNVRDVLYRVYGVQATILEQQHRFREEAAARQRVVALSPAGQTNLSRAILAMALARAGDHRGAAAEVEVLKPALQADTSWEYYGHLAQVCSRALEALRLDSAVSSSERSVLGQRYSALALELLGKAKARAGADAWCEVGREIRTQEPWKPLREAVDLRPLLEDAAPMK